MSYKGFDRALVEKVNPAHVRHYLLSSDWERVSEMGEDIAVFRRDNGDEEVVVPVTREFPEYFYRRMVEAIADIALYEERESRDVLRDVLTGP